MKTVEKSVLVLHSAAQMFDLVDRVEDYPQFLPWYGRTEVLMRTENELKARLYMDYRGVKQSFATHNRNTPGEAISMDLLEGPFKTLNGTWRFVDLGDDMCQVVFKLQYDFANPMLAALISPVFGHLAGKLVDAFTAEADRRYGR
ncbi:type II toxin-antitoxin system RatA family toxin [Neisseria leonii]|uniref:type II toxin-antitoxin system RatA family toxin n=1 Tax=Neisseria leonii TaxID=2995413 RepID=UPI00237A29F8|nr:type II toxin-antitoxin system RatA family toxin [Neisseria sp. 3986]MDD9326419.1 type II toxin-antitoxin system RatA family toxin [Neisseria sp. 3986]